MESTAVSLSNFFGDSMRFIEILRYMNKLQITQLLYVYIFVMGAYTKTNLVSLLISKIVLKF